MCNIVLKRINIYKKYKIEYDKYYIGLSNKIFRIIEY